MIIDSAWWRLNFRSPWTKWMLEVELRRKQLPRAWRWVYVNIQARTVQTLKGRIYNSWIWINWPWRWKMQHSDLQSIKRSVFYSTAFVFRKGRLLALIRALEIMIFQCVLTVEEVIAACVSSDTTSYLHQNTCVWWNWKVTSYWKFGLCRFVPWWTNHVMVPRAGI